ncbi:MAG: hypothetical protein JWR60_2742 [Polaromonas sp.]|nr:hypothetical protein [Polaromonas sp.]
MQNAHPSSPAPPKPVPAHPASSSSLRSELLSGAKQGFLLATALLAIGLPAAHFMKTREAPAPSATATAEPAQQAGRTTAQTPGTANFGAEPASGDARFIANWVARSGDNRAMSFVIIDKKNAKVFVFDPQARLLGATPVLLGAARGDHTVPGIGERPLAQVRPEERTTPAGRFVGEPGRNASGEDVVWVDYDAAVSMHRVRTGNARDRRLERLATPSIADNRISYGCVNLPAAFYDNVLSPVFRERYGVVYVLPEVRPLREVFAGA